MTIEDIQKIIQTDETHTLELKKTTGELKDGMHSACAFLNAGGGWLMFGITPTSLKIIGQQVTDTTRQDIGNAIAGLEPRLDVPVMYVDIPDKPGFQVIAMHFDGWSWGKEPFTYRGCPYIRSESTTQIMPREMFNERLKDAHPTEFAWENQAALNFATEDLDESKIRGVVRLGVERGRMNAAALVEPVDMILEKWKLLKDGKPTNGAAALFAKEVKSYSQFGLKMARFRGTDKNEFIDNKKVEGNFFELLDAGMEFLFKHLSISGKIVGLRREEKLEIPAEALREATINCLCHRAMEFHNTTPQIAIYNDRIEISNPGRLAAGITPENIKTGHFSHPYNPNIADVLFKSTFLENWGSGVGRILETCKEQGVPEPFWYEHDGFVTVTFPMPDTQGDTQADTQGDTQGINDLDKWLLNQIKSAPSITSEKLASLSGKSVITIKRHLKKMKNVRYVGSGYSGHWEVDEK